MGVLLFTVVAIGSIYWLTAFLRSFSNDLPSSRREAFTLGYPRAPMSGEPVIKPVDETEVKKMPERLPQVKLDYGPIVAPVPVVDRSAEVLPNFKSIPAKTEESLLFRSLAVGMFAVGIIAVDFAAGTHFSWVGIPFSTTGAVWSWIRRHHAKHWLNSLVSVVSLGLLFGVFVSILFKQIPPAIDLFAPASRVSVAIQLTLGAIVISLQMGLSFHLYSRKALGYCLLTSIILIGVAAGLSTNIGFLILLCGFVAIAIPTLTLDYRSRLALQPIGIQSFPPQGQLSYQSLPWKYLIQLAAISIGLGIILSIFLPNFRLPDLSFKPPGIDNIKTIAQQYRQPPQNPPSPAPTNSNSLPSINQQELARKVFGQANNNNYPDTIKQENLQLPPELTSQLQQFTQQILATSSQPLNSDFDRSTYIAEYLKQHHQDAPTPVTSANLPPLDPKSIQALIAKCSDDPKTCKLVGSQQDLPVVYTSMLRSIGIPARLKTGEKLAQIDPQTKLYPRPTDKPTSQTEMYSPNWGWVNLDSTPDRPVVNLTPEQIDRLQAQAQQQFGATLSASATPQSSLNTPNPQPDRDRSIADAAAREPEGTSGIERDKTDGKPFDNSSPPNQQNPTNSPTPPAEIPKDFDPTILKAIAIFIAIIGGIAWYLWYRKKEQQQLATLPPIERIYRSMIVSLIKTGNTKVPAQTQLEYARSIKNTEHHQIAKIVEEISQLYTAWRYGNQKIDVNHLAKKLQNLQHLQQLAAERKRQQWIANQKALWVPGHNSKN
jgi:transglutaminase-like putative cysteine protease